MAKANYEHEIDANGAADQWGSGGDPCRTDFLAGYYDQVAGNAAPTAPDEMDRSAAYNSGWIAAREQSA